MKTIILLTFLLGSTLLIKSQSTISGKVIDANGEAVAFANAVLYLAADSQMMKAEITDMDGIFKMSGISQGDYHLKISFVGYTTYESETFSLSDNSTKSFDNIQLITDENVLDAVEITTERALIEVQPDKTIFNVEGSVNATGNTALELLRKAPGVMVDNNDNIILLGKSGTQIYIDGKPSPLGGEDLAMLLRSMQSSEIEAIEIITNPSSKYEAEGDAGIINIRLKKDKRFGGNANINLGYNQGFYAKYNGTVNMNYRNKFVNLFGMYSVNTGTWRNYMDFDKYMDELNTFTNSINKHSGPYNSYKFGSDFFLNKFNTLGFIVDGSFNNTKNYSTSVVNIFDASTNDPVSNLDASSESNGNQVNLHTNVNYRFDNLDGNTWNIDGDYGNYDNTNNAYQPNTYYDPMADTIIEENIYTSQAPTLINLYTANVDHERKLGPGKLGAGIKFSYVTTDNTYDYYEVINDEEILDVNRSNNFVYEENINAAYLNYAFAVKKFNISLGLRAEQTNSIGTLTSLVETADDTVTRQYLDFFPSGGVSYSINQKNALRLNYSRRIQRPNYQDLNPFEFKMNELSYRKGNPFLQPQYTQSIQLTHTYNYSLSSTLRYSYTTDFFSSVSDTAADGAGYIQTLNIGTQQVFGLNVSYPFSITKWWSTYTNAGVFSLHNEGVISDDRPIDLKQTTFNLYHQSTFNVTDKFSLELSGWFNSPSVWGAVFQTEANWSIDAGAQYKVFKERGNIKVAYTDLFNTAPWQAKQDIEGLYMDVEGGWESQQVRISFSYLFGNDQVKSSRNRKTGI
ncbi:MAG: TonB-dependent receptor, partial [Chitinophagales bacterium]|nr:TonB-dependent receptor [Chitinophagales bacterium]MBP9703138.1 TonB-dependent receptor [Chitinophagales bacterium]